MGCFNSQEDYENRVRSGPLPDPLEGEPVTMKEWKPPHLTVKAELDSFLIERQTSWPPEDITMNMITILARRLDMIEARVRELESKK